MLTIIPCFEKWDAELRNVNFEIRIDRKNLKYFITFKKLPERQIKWFLFPSKYDFVINYNRPPHYLLTLLVPPSHTAFSATSRVFQFRDFSFH